MSWPEIWPEVEDILRNSRTRAQALCRVEELREMSTSWDALARAGRRQGTCALELLGQAFAAPKVTVSPSVLTYEGGRKHLVIPDTQVKPGVPTSHFRAIGRYIVAKQPEVVIHLGDHWDMPSLSSYDSATSKAARGVAKKRDIDAGNAAWEELENELEKGNYQPPVKIFLEGNHDGFAPQGRIGRMLNEHPGDAGLITVDKFADSWTGWQRVPFLTPIFVDGIAYCHLFPLNRKGRRTMYGVRAGASHPDIQVAAMRRSATAGHKQGLHLGALHHAPGQCAARGLIAGSCYQHDEEYLDPATYWRGVIMKHNVDPENNPNHYSLCEVDLGFLLKRYG